MSQLRIALVAGETSGDYLGAELIKELKQYYPDIHFEGIAGPRMIAQGCTALYSMERLSIMGFTEVLGRLFELVGLRRRLIKRWKEMMPQVFIGIDAPAFNLGLEHGLKRHGIKTVHYVSPQVWAWRPGRIKSIKKAIQLMLTVFPFETEIYSKNNIPVEFVGHPLADEIPILNDPQKARKYLDIGKDAKVLAILPGSRSNEIQSLCIDFIKSAKLIQNNIDTLQVVIPLVHAKHETYVRQIHQQYAPTIPLKIFIGQSRQVITAADAVLLASGTATLETLLIKRPMVVAYRLKKSSYWLAKRMVKTPFIAMPNLLAGRAVVPELVQNDVTPDKIADALLPQFNDSKHVAELNEQFTAIHNSLKKNASKQAAKIVLSLVQNAA